jgi:hypothetical protein
MTTALGQNGTNHAGCNRPHAWIALQGECSICLLQVVNTYYDRDAAVAGDAPLQAFVRALIDPKGANLRQINQDNAVRTKAALIELTAHLLYRVYVRMP